MQIIPTILEKDFELAEAKIRRVKELNRWIQIDVVDGSFVEGKSFELELLNSLGEEGDDILWEVHLMVKEPKNWIAKCNFVSACRIVGQVEQMSNRESFVSEVKNSGLEVGLAIDIDSEIGEIPEETDVIILLARKAGFGTYEFDNRVFEKIEKLKEIKERNGLGFLIGIDGGVNENNIRKLAKAGVDISYCGGAIFNGMVEENLEKLKYASEN